MQCGKSKPRILWQFRGKVPAFPAYLPLLFYSNSVLEWSRCSSPKYRVHSHLPGLMILCFFMLHLFIFCLFIQPTWIESVLHARTCVLYTADKWRRGPALPLWIWQRCPSQSLLLPLNPPSMTTQPMVISLFLSSSYCLSHVKSCTVNGRSLSIYWLIIQSYRKCKYHGAIKILDYFKTLLLFC